MTNSREHRRQQRHAKRTLFALALCSLAATVTSVNAEVHVNPYANPQTPEAAQPLNVAGTASAAPQPRPSRLPIVRRQPKQTLPKQTLPKQTLPNEPLASEPLQVKEPGPKRPIDAPAQASPTARNAEEASHDRRPKVKPIADSPGVNFVAAHQRVTQVSDKRAAAELNSVSWLQSSTPSSEQKESLELLEQATREYSVGAWASAETTAWNSLRRAAEGIDIADRMTRPAEHRFVANAASELQIARDAIREARDFAGIYGSLDVDGVRRIVRSHRTEVLKRERADVPPTDAIDRYLNDARIRLSRLASCRVEAAQAMDLLAAIHLGRDEAAALPSQTALCLRRAALQGQPGNGSLALRLGMHLADLGLDQEAAWALEHSLNIEPTREAAETLATVTKRSQLNIATRHTNSQLQVGHSERQQPTRPRIPEVVQLSPQEFATVSPSVIQVPTDTRIGSTAAPASAQTAAPVQATAFGQEAETAPVDDLETNPTPRLFNVKPKLPNVKKLLGPLGKLW